MTVGTKIDALTHVNLGTGLISHSHREGIDINDAVVCLTTYARAQNEFVPIPAVAGYNFDGYTMRAQILSAPSDSDCTPGAAIIFFCGPDEEPVITSAIARRPSHGPDMWRILINSAQTPICAVEYQREPWVATRLDSGAMRHAAMLPALAVLERTLAWAWLDYYADLEKHDDKVIDFRLERARRTSHRGEMPPMKPTAELLVSDNLSGTQEIHLLEDLHRRVALGDGDAQFRLAQAYESGHIGLVRNAEKTFELYLLSAQNGSIKAQCCVGILYACGEGVAQNDEQAVHWYQKAARAGSAQAQCNLGYCYEIGRRPLAKTMQEANRWYRRSALRDYDVAQYNLGMSYRLGRDLPQDDDLANRWFARAARQGNPEAQCALGFSYAHGRGVSISHSKAVELYAAAASSGHAIAQQNYGYMLESGLGVTRDLSKAVEWYRAAAQQGLASAQSCLASMYEHGLGISQNFDEALVFYKLSAAQGDERAIQSVARLSKEMALIKGRADLNAIGEKMKATDPSYEAKRAILVPALKPVIARIEPSQWAATFEEAYKNLSASTYTTTSEVSSPISQPEQKLPPGTLGKLINRIRTIKWPLRASKTKDVQIFIEVAAQVFEKISLGRSHAASLYGSEPTVKMQDWQRIEQEVKKIVEAGTERFRAALANGLASLIHCHHYLTLDDDDRELVAHAWNSGTRDEHDRLYTYEFAYLYVWCEILQYIVFNGWSGTPAQLENLKRNCNTLGEQCEAENVFFLSTLKNKDSGAQLSELQKEQGKTMMILKEGARRAVSGEPFFDE